MDDRDAGEAELRRVAAGGPDRIGPAIAALAATPHGRAFLRRSAAAAHLDPGKTSKRKAP
jgi:hypothetical protein